MKIYIGEKDGNPLYEDINQIGNICLVGGPGSGKTTYIIRLIYELIAANDLDSLKIIVHDSKKVDYLAISKSRYLLFDVTNDFQMDELRQNIISLKKICEERLLTNVCYPHIFVFIDDGSLLNYQPKDLIDNIVEIISNSKKANIHFVIANQSFKFFDSKIGDDIDTTIVYSFNSNEELKKVGITLLEAGKSGDAFVFSGKNRIFTHQNK